MLKLMVMNIILIHPVLKFVLIFTSILFQINPNIPQIHNPHSGDILQGVITIIGSTNLSGYDHHQISFNYVDSQADTWFLIAKSDNIVSDGELATWDTTTIADGNYKIRLEVFLKDGGSREILVDELRVRNYTPIETQSITPQLMGVEGILETDVPFSVTAIPLPGHDNAKNTLTVSMEDFYKSLAGGVVLSFSIFLFLVIYSAFRGIL